MAEPMIVKCNLSGSNQERVNLSFLGGEKREFENKSNGVQECRLH